MGKIENKESETNLDVAADSKAVSEAVAGMSDADQAQVWQVVHGNLSGGSFRDPSGGAAA